MSQERKNVLASLRLANQAYPHNVSIKNSSKDIVSQQETFSSEIFEIAGRILFLRTFGKFAFIKLQDFEGVVQIAFDKSITQASSFNLLKSLHLGDIISAKGCIFRTQAGEVTLKVTEAQLLTKCLHTPPEKFHGLQDAEIKQRKRYLDLINNPKSKEVFIWRSKIVSQIRRFFEDMDFLEVETPMLQNIPTGALATPFKTHHKALDMELFLRIAPELYLKRLVVGGFHKVFELNRNFRNEGLSTKHNPEFTMIEFYEAYNNYQGLMAKIENLIKHLCLKIHNQNQCVFNENIINVSNFQIMTMEESILKYTNFKDLSFNSLKVLYPNEDLSHGELINKIFEEQVEKHLIQPHFITEHPLDTSPLARKSEKVSISGIPTAERFELYIGAMEIANGFNELNDPEDQKNRFLIQAQNHAKGKAETHPVDLDYIEALEWGMPPTAGAGIGVDRLVMVLLGLSNLRESILFPTLKNID